MVRSTGQIELRSVNTLLDKSESNPKLQLKVALLPEQMEGVNSVNKVRTRPADAWSTLHSLVVKGVLPL